MQRRRKKKIKYKNLLILVGVIVLIVFIINKLPKKEIITADIIDTYVGKNISELDLLAKDNEFTIKKEYQYSKTLDKDKIISTNFNNNKIDVIVSKGIIDDKLYSEKKVNELGNVPIMMYHGIIDTEDNKYTGGNVDKDGYNRTAKAFREDLEFYYQSGYRMIRLTDYVNGIVNVEMGYSPIIITFDDGDKNNFNVLGRKDDGSLDIDPNCAIGILEEYKKKYPDFNVTATFFVMAGIFNQSTYNEEIVNWLVDHGYDVGNHTTIHPDFTTITTAKTQEVVGKMYQKLDDLLGDKYVKIVALPYGSPYKKTHENYQYILNGNYNGYEYSSEAALRVGWEPELSPFHKDFDKTFLKRCRAYDNNGKEFDIKMVFTNLEKNKYISDGDENTIVIRESDSNKINSNYTNVITYKEIEE
jgi:peptidoglycan/xylan/chitin deacetylase (PgdA/CDA1 family)